MSIRSSLDESTAGKTVTLVDGTLCVWLYSPGWGWGEGPLRWYTGSGMLPSNVRALNRGVTGRGELVLVAMSEQPAPAAAPAVPPPAPVWPPAGCRVIDTTVEPYKTCRNPIGYGFHFYRGITPKYFRPGDERTKYTGGRFGWWGACNNHAVVPADWTPEPALPDLSALGGLATFMRSAAGAMLWRGMLRLSKRHRPAWGRAPMHGDVWTVPEGISAWKGLAYNSAGVVRLALDELAAGRCGIDTLRVVRDRVQNEEDRRAV